MILYNKTHLLIDSWTKFLARVSLRRKTGTDQLFRNHHSSKTVGHSIDIGPVGGDEPIITRCLTMYDI